MLRTLIIALGAILITLAFAWLGGTAALGAHPKAWPVQVAVIGAPIGVIVALILGAVVPSKLPRVILFAILLGIAYFLAENGHKDFAASYAEDQTAGKFWFFGWIATCAAATALMNAVAGR